MVMPKAQLPTRCYSHHHWLQLSLPRIVPVPMTSC